MSGLCGWSPTRGLERLRPGVRRVGAHSGAVSCTLRKGAVPMGVAGLLHSHSRSEPALQEPGVHSDSCSDRPRLSGYSPCACGRMAGGVSGSTSVAQIWNGYSVRKLQL